jgi:hypothetical protein
MTSKDGSAVTYRQQQEVAGTRTVRWSMALSKVLVPVLRPLTRLPGLRGRIDGTLAARLGTASSRLEKGNFVEAFGVALAGAADSRRRRPFLFNPQALNEILWWSFMHCAVRAAAHLGDDERNQVDALLESPPFAGGMREAECLDVVARWRWEGGDREGALDLARRAVLADPTWPFARVLLAWFGLVTGQLDPTEPLLEAVRLAPATLATIEADPVFSKHPQLIESLRKKRH